MTDRNRAIGFARRTRRNLEFIDQAGCQGEDVHRVTQITLSLLGLLVFPIEKPEKEHLEPAMRKVRIAELEGRGWPTWEITLDEGKPKTETLYDLTWHLRNAVSHGLLAFSSDSSEPTQVEVVAKDRLSRGAAPYWSAQIRADNLRDFCLELLKFYEHTL